METKTSIKQLESSAKSGLNEYLLVAHPSAEVSEKIQEEKQFFYQQYQQKVSVKAAPHITVASFLAKEEMEETIIRYIQRICNQQQSFSVMVNNYSGFPPHTIYLRVQNQQPFKKLAKELTAVAYYIESCYCPPAKLMYNPHITIATKLPATVYLNALMDYGQKTFHEIFMVNELVLLRRTSQHDSGKSINVFGLQPFAHTLFN